MNPPDDEMSMLNSAMNLQFELGEKEEVINFWLYLILRAVSIFAALLSFVLLIASSYFNSRPIGAPFHIIGWCLSLPVLLFVAYSAWTSITLSVSFGNKRREIEKNVRAATLRLTSPYPS